MTAVEIDGAITRVAKDQFGFNETERLKVVNEDGIEFMNKLDLNSSKLNYNTVLKSSLDLWYTLRALLVTVVNYIRLFS